MPISSLLFLTLKFSIEAHFFYCVHNPWKEIRSTDCKLIGLFRFRTFSTDIKREIVFALVSETISVKSRSVVAKTVSFPNLERSVPQVPQTKSGCKFEIAFSNFGWLCSLWRTYKFYKGYI